MKNVIGYLRVSTDGQVGEDKYGLDAQKEQIERYCESHQMNIVKWIKDEGESGAKERPGMDMLCCDDVTYSNPPYDAVVTAKTDRIARDINVYYYYKMMLRKKDIQLISVSEDFGQAGQFASFLEAFTVCVAEMERRNITVRMSGGRMQKAKKGGYAGGKVPYGYKAVNGRLEIEDSEAEVVRKIYHYIKDLEYSYRGIIEVLKKEGYKTRGGKDFSVSTIQSILKNEKLYEGYYKYGANSEWVKGQQEAIF